MSITTNLIPPAPTTNSPVAGVQAFDPFLSAPSPPPLDDAVEEILDRPDDLTPEQIARLRNTLSPPAELEDYGASFSLTDEINEQLRAVRAMRRQIMIGNNIREGLNPREVREAVAASSSLLSTLLKVHEKVMSFERQRAIENAVIETVRELPEPAKEAFFINLETRLAAIE